MSKGTSKRIWGELYKVIDSSDILLQVLDVRDPLGTRCYFLEKFVAKEKPFKHVVLVLNKCDLVPKWVTLRWVSLLSKEYPTVAFRSSLHRPFGKKSLIGLLRQFADGLKNRKNVTVGLVGYPNVGKSSVINTLRGKKVCNVAPIPGETKVWQYVDLTKRLYLLDCPGVVKEVGEGDADVAKVVKGVVRAEKLADPCEYIDAIIKLVGVEKFLQHYKLPAALAGYADALEVLEALAQKLGLLGKGGEPLSAQAAVRVIFDLQRAKLPYFCAPPAESAEDVAAALQARQLQEIAAASKA
uniref:Nucleolar GTP-binding protein 2-like n=1 Tax=Dermatophagoides pteronyssinus TaxID=6956 RepID=A0A6P6Y7S1_DERPT|nr:nucleolar GTP-binding protein 2-like [Dermatophagoides pteronyssinus]